MHSQEFFLILPSKSVLCLSEKAFGQSYIHLVLNLSYQIKSNPRDKFRLNTMSKDINLLTSLTKACRNNNHAATNDKIIVTKRAHWTNTIEVY